MFVLHLPRQLRFVVCAISLCLSFVASANEIRIGVVTDQNGINADVGRDYLAGARTYFDYINANGGVRGRKLTLIVKDDEGVAGNTLRLTRELIGSDRVDALFGYTGDENIALVAKDTQFKSSRIALYGPLSGMEIGDAGDSLVFVRPTYKDEVRHIVQHFSQLYLSQFAVVHMNNSFGIGLAGEVATELKTRNMQAAAQFELNPALSGLGALTQRVLSTKPQVIIVAADTIAMAEFVKKVRAIDKGVNIVGLSTVSHRTLMELAKADYAAGTMITQVVPNPLVSATKLQTEHLAMIAKFRDEPPSHLTLEGFMAAKGLVKAIERINGDINRASIAAAVSGTKRFDLEGMTLAFGSANDRGSRFVDIAYLRKSGRLVQ
ncbi:MAG: ABC transporter substrate-binding protein [Betaproteobacteria bacterium]|nr:ABC transporter substrate-binding protein [Betaproteobacteria bacterium]